MSIIQRIPNEILLKIFEKLQTPDLLQCEVVCKAWHLISHTALLCKVDLCGDVAVEQFIASIDHNPDASYLNAVKTINMDCIQDSNNVVDGAKTLSKLFFRFPNLINVKISDSFDLLKIFSNIACPAVLDNCPKLSTFEIDYRDDWSVRQKNVNDYIDAVKRVRTLLTAIDLGKFNSPMARDIQGVAQLMKSFPRLKTIRGLTREFNNIETTLPVFEMLPKLTGVSIIKATSDAQGFFENYISTKSKKDIDQLVKRLSKVNEFGVSYHGDICANGLQFINEYLTGLQSLTLSYKRSGSWTQEQQKLLIAGALNSVCSVNNGTLQLKAFRTKLLPEYLSRIMRYMSSQIPAGNQLKRVLRVNSACSLYGTGVAEENELTEKTLNLTVNLKRWSFVQDVEVGLYYFIDIKDIPRKLFAFDDYVQHQDVFVLTIGRRWRYDDFPKINYYDPILCSLPVTKELILDIPNTFQDDWTIYERNEGTVRVPMVEEVTLRPATSTRYATILSRISSSCPNLKRLNIYYSLGKFDKNDGGFRLSLTGCNLETLTIDVTPVRLNMTIFRRHNRKFIPQDFFLLEIDYPNGERSLYKVSMDFSAANKIQSGDLQNFTRGKDYLRVHISISSLKHLKLCINIGSKIYDDDERELYFHTPGKTRDIIYKDVF